MYLSVNNRTSEEEQSSDIEDVEYYNNNIHPPVFSRDHRVLKPLEVMELLVGNKKLFPSKVCTSQPLQVEHHCTFVVDMNSLASSKDIKCDDMREFFLNTKYLFRTDAVTLHNAQTMFVSLPVQFSKTIVEQFK